MSEIVLYVKEPHPTAKTIRSAAATALPPASARSRIQSWFGVAAARLRGMATEIGRSEILKHGFLDPCGSSPTALPTAGRERGRTHEIVRGRHSIAASTALCLARYSAHDAQSCMDLQTSCELLVADRTPRRALQPTRARRSRVRPSRGCASTAPPSARVAAGRWANRSSPRAGSRRHRP